jgi:hypothetical protein
MLITHLHIFLTPVHTHVFIHLYILNLDFKCIYIFILVFIPGTDHSKVVVFVILKSEVALLLIFVRVTLILIPALDSGFILNLVLFIFAVHIVGWIQNYQHWRGSVRRCHSIVEDAGRLFEKVGLPCSNVNVTWADAEKAKERVSIHKSEEETCKWPDTTTPTSILTAQPHRTACLPSSYRK